VAFADPPAVAFVAVLAEVVLAEVVLAEAVLAEAGAAIAGAARAPPIAASAAPTATEIRTCLADRRMKCRTGSPVMLWSSRRPASPELSLMDGTTQGHQGRFPKNLPARLQGASGHAISGSCHIGSAGDLLE
jgi:hypothetical protein